MNRYHIHYFSLFRDCVGKEAEEWETSSTDLKEIYADLNEKYQFNLKEADINVAVNDEFTDWNHSLSSGDKLVFMTPVSGG